MLQKLWKKVVEEDAGYDSLPHGNCIHDCSGVLSDANIRFTTVGLCPIHVRPSRISRLPACRQLDFADSTRRNAPIKKSLMYARRSLTLAAHEHTPGYKCTIRNQYMPSKSSSSTKILFLHEHARMNTPARKRPINTNNRKLTLSSLRRQYSAQRASLRHGQLLRLEQDAAEERVEC